MAFRKSYVAIVGIQYKKCAVDIFDERPQNSKGSAIECNGGGGGGDNEDNISISSHHSANSSDSRFVVRSSSSCTGSIGSSASHNLSDELLRTTNQLH